MTRRTSRSLDRFAAALFGVACVLFLFQASTLHRDLQSLNPDVTVFYLPWYEHILSHGRWASLEASFTNYSPPYVYLLSLVSFADGLFDRVVLIKLATAPFILLSGWLTFDLCRALAVPRGRAIATGALLLVTPEIWRNSLHWGQCDIIYTSLLIGFVRLIVAKRPASAMAVFGVALAFKLQTIFAGPALLALLLTGEIAAWQVVLVPLFFVLCMIPAALAGRPWKDLILIYFQQYGYYDTLGMHVPNPFFMIQHRIHPQYTNLASKAGVLVAAVAALLIVAAYVRRRRMQNPTGILVMMTLSLLIEPYLLPKMHDRYFFAGDTFAVLLIAFRPAMAIPAALLQAAAYITYRQFLNNLPFTSSSMRLPVVMVTIAIALVAWQFGREGREPARHPGELL